MSGDGLAGAGDQAGPLAVSLLVLVPVLPVVAAVQPHVTVESRNVLELPGTDAALHHVLHGVRLYLGDGADGLDEGMSLGLDGDCVTLLALSDQLL